jgi:hypothetical protein
VLGSTKGQRSNQRLLWSGAPDCPVCHRIVSGAPEDFSSNSSPSGNFQSQRTKIHRTVRCTPDSVRCSFETRLRNSPVSGIRKGCSAIIHRTVRCNLGATATSHQRSPAGAFNARQKRAVVRHAGAGAPDTLQCMSGAPPDIKAGPETELQRLTQRPFGDVAVAPDMSGVHRTVRCTIRQTASTNGQVWWLGL